jgi:hypothetical protein
VTTSSTIAGIKDYAIARGAFDAAVVRWPGAVITLRQGRLRHIGHSPHSIGLTGGRMSRGSNLLPSSNKMAAKSLAGVCLNRSEAVGQGLPRPIRQF